MDDVFIMVHGVVGLSCYRENFPLCRQCAKNQLSMTDLNDNLKNFIELELEKAAELCVRTMTINSHSDNPVGVNEVQNIFCGELSELGFKLELRRPKEYQLHE